MDLEAIREYCLSLPHVTERVQWGNDLLFSIGGKMFAVATLDAKYSTKLSFKCTPEKFAELVESEGIIPAPYVARYHWVALERFNALSDKELKDLIASLTEEENEISYKRRVLHGKIDILRAELVNRLRQKRESGASIISGDDVEQLTQILAGKAQGAEDEPAA